VLNKTQSIDPSQWPDLFVFLFTIDLPMEGIGPFVLSVRCYCPFLRQYW